MTRYLILGVMISTLAACGGGGSSSSSGGGTPVPSSQDYAIFTSTASGNTNLKAYDPVSGTISTIPTTALLYEAAIAAGTIDPSTQSTSNLHISDVLYEDNGSFNSVSTSQSGNLAVSQHSTYSGTVCNQSLTNNYLVVVDAGPDAICSSSDDRVYAITTNMASTDTPILLPARPSVVLFSNYTTPLGLLYVSGGTLFFSDANGQNATALLNSVTSVSEMDSVGNSVLLNIDGNLEVFDESNQTLSGQIYPASNPSSRAYSDGTNFYFLDGKSIYAIPLNGSGYSSVDFGISTASDITLAGVHGHYLVFYTYDTNSKDRTIDSIDLTKPNNVNGIKTLVTSTYPASVSLMTFTGNYIYYELTSGNSDVRGDIAAATLIDGSGTPQGVTGASWVGYAYASNISADGLSIASLILDKFTTDSLGNPTGGDISVYDTATDSVISSQGALPAGIVKFSGIGVGADIYGDFYDTGGSAYLAHLNVTMANSMKQIDMSTTGVMDAPIL